MDAAPSWRARARVVLLSVLLGATLSLAACGPEADRDQGDGDGSGADPGNRGDSVELLGDEAPLDRIYLDTPKDERPLTEGE